MNIMPQMKLFGESEFEELGDLERLQKVLGTLNDAGLIRKLYRIRGKGRNGWPREVMWNSFIASFLFEHETVESLLRELRRNRQLRALCGFEPKSVKQEDGSIKVYVAPSKSAYSKFLKNLTSCQKELDEMFTEQVPYMYENLEHFGEILMVDGKRPNSFTGDMTRGRTA
ncbi:MAG: transposase [Butyrivibrio sp.]|nr:transposase [Muribaculum sp.]MCM1552614.1 transposase [Butyrivibrio sp.]